MTAPRRPARNDDHRHAVGDAVGPPTPADDTPVDWQGERLGTPGNDNKPPRGTEIDTRSDKPQRGRARESRRGQR